MQYQDKLSGGILKQALRKVSFIFSHRIAAATLDEVFDITIRYSLSDQNIAPDTAALALQDCH